MRHTDAKRAAKMQGLLKRIKQEKTSLGKGLTSRNILLPSHFAKYNFVIAIFCFCSFLDVCANCA